MPKQKGHLFFEIWGQLSSLNIDLENSVVHFFFELYLSQLTVRFNSDFNCCGSFALC